MSRTLRKENPLLRQTLHHLHKLARSQPAPIWLAVAERIERSRRSSPPLNVGHLERLADAHEVIVVPGKVLADGRLSKALTVAASSFSAGARRKIAEAGGETLTIEELSKLRPDGQGVRILA